MSFSPDLSESSNPRHREPLHRERGSIETSPRRWAEVRSAIGRLRVMRATDRAKTLNLALQGGGAHGAFTWGVLDRLLEDGRIRFDTISGASAGAVNAVAMADGFAKNGAEGARQTLDAVWRDIADSLDPGQSRSGLFGLWPFGQVQNDMREMAVGMMTRMMSPYQFNPFDVNPLRDTIRRIIDFDRLRRQTTISLIISATEVATGRARLFTKSEVTPDVVLASACLPQLFRAVEIDGQHYWDGGYSANPPLYPLIDGSSASDTLIVQLRGSDDPRVPKDTQDILARTQQVVFNQPLRLEVEKIAAARHAARGGLFGYNRHRRLLGHRFHHIAAGEVTAAPDGASSTAASWADLVRLRDAGRDAAETWLAIHFHDIGRRETVDLTGGAF